MKSTRWRGGSRPRQSRLKRRWPSASRFGVAIQSSPPGRSRSFIRRRSPAGSYRCSITWLRVTASNEPACSSGSRSSSVPCVTVSPASRARATAAGSGSIPCACQPRARHLGDEGAAPTAHVEQSPSGRGGQVANLPVNQRAARRRNARDQTPARDGGPLRVAPARPPVVPRETRPQAAGGLRGCRRAVRVVGPVGERDGLRGRAWIQVSGAAVAAPHKRPVPRRRAEGSVA